MRTSKLAALLAAAGIALTACAAGEAAPATGDEPATLEPSGVEGISRVTLKAEAAERIGLQTGAIAEEAVSGVQRKVMPYSALLYDAKGETYAYGNPSELVFVRVKVTVDTIAGDKVVLTDGPAAGTKVVTVGAPELFGAEFEVGE
ncbi:hypothetical protein SAMN05421504_101378 [Amycolatopsis xylanica]|uniref:Lipoprotein n=1 Tax=Amycolatopsis xylanica TaxID=589385 RepID=A0A1H2SYP2_9PSEU|nr:hypothetical protein [Amycolatopsis xylanica]SDW36124.1 hypothetical protein SAMN05421504_101378 [Amycolatopsis xylanica]